MVMQTVDSEVMVAAQSDIIWFYSHVYANFQKENRRSKTFDSLIVPCTAGSSVSCT